MWKVYVDRQMREIFAAIIGIALGTIGGWWLAQVI
jgi:hypothetical protein